MTRSQLSVIPVLALPLFLLGINANPAKADAKITSTATVVSPSANDPGMATGHRVVGVVTNHTVDVTGGTANGVFGLGYTINLIVDGAILGTYYYPQTTGTYGVAYYNSSGEYHGAGSLSLNVDLTFGNHTFKAYTSASGSGIPGDTKEDEKTRWINLGTAPVDPGGS